MCLLPRLRLGSGDGGYGWIDLCVTSGQKDFVGGLEDVLVGGSGELPVCDGGADGGGQLQDPQRIDRLGTAASGKFRSFVTNVIQKGLSQLTR